MSENKYEGMEFVGSLELGPNAKPTPSSWSRTSGSYYGEGGVSRAPWNAMIFDIYKEKIFKEGVIHDYDWFRQIAHYDRDSRPFWESRYSLYECNANRYDEDIDYGAVYDMLGRKFRELNPWTIPCRNVGEDIRFALTIRPWHNNLGAFPKRVHVDWFKSNVTSNGITIRGSTAGAPSMTDNVTNDAFNRLFIGDNYTITQVANAAHMTYMSSDEGYGKMLATKPNTNLSNSTVSGIHLLASDDGVMHFCNDFTNVSATYGTVELKDGTTEKKNFRDKTSHVFKMWDEIRENALPYFYLHHPLKNTTWSVPDAPSYKSLRITEQHGNTIAAPIVLKMPVNGNVASLFVHPVSKNNTQMTTVYLDDILADVVLYIDDYDPNRHYYVSLIHYLLPESKNNLTMTTVLNSVALRLTIYVRPVGTPVTGTVDDYVLLDYGTRSFENVNFKNNYPPLTKNKNVANKGTNNIEYIVASVGHYTDDSSTERLSAVEDSWLIAKPIPGLVWRTEGNPANNNSTPITGLGYHGYGYSPRITHDFFSYDYRHKNRTMNLHEFPLPEV